MIGLSLPPLAFPGPRTLSCWLHLDTLTHLPDPPHPQSSSAAVIDSFIYVEALQDKSRPLHLHCPRHNSTGTVFPHCRSFECHALVMEPRDETSSFHTKDENHEPLPYFSQGGS